MAKSRDIKKRPVFQVVVIFALISVLIYVVSSTTSPSTKGQEVIRASIEKIDALVDDDTILSERYSLTFDDSMLDQERSIFEDNKGSVKTITPNLKVVRKDAGKNYLFIGQDTKNNFYDRFTVEKIHFDKRRKKAYAAVLINSYISRGITMYSGYAPRQFWKKLLTDLAITKNLEFKQNKNSYQLQLDSDKYTKIVLYLDKKTFLPSRLKLDMDSSKVWHDESTYKSLDLKVVERKSIKTDQSAFKITIPSNYKSRDIIIKKSEEEEHEKEDSNLDEAICDSCHYKELKVKRFEIQSAF